MKQFERERKGERERVRERERDDRIETKFARERKSISAGRNRDGEKSWVSRIIIHTLVSRPEVGANRRGTERRGKGGAGGGKEGGAGRTRADERVLEGTDMVLFLLHIDRCG
jgi:hypothetical protein